MYDPKNRIMQLSEEKPVEFQLTLRQNKKNRIYWYLVVRKMTLMDSLGETQSEICWLLQKYIIIPQFIGGILTNYFSWLIGSEYNSAFQIQIPLSYDG